MRAARVKRPMLLEDEHTRFMRLLAESMLNQEALLMASSRKY